jgi:hypothetical protein
MVAGKARRSCRPELVQGSGSHRSLHVGFAEVHHKTLGFLGWATKSRPEARWAEKWSARAVNHQCWGTLGGIAGLVSVGRGLRQRRGCLMKEDRYLTILPVRVCVCLHLCSRGSLVICPTHRDFIYIALGFQDNSFIRTGSHFPAI